MVSALTDSADPLYNVIGDDLKINWRYSIKGDIRIRDFWPRVERSAVTPQGLLQNGNFIEHAEAMTNSHIGPNCFLIAAFTLRKIHRHL